MNCSLINCFFAWIPKLTNESCQCLFCMRNGIFIYDKNFWNDKSLEYLKKDKIKSQLKIRCQVKVELVRIIYLQNRNRIPLVMYMFQENKLFMFHQHPRMKKCVKTITVCGNQRQTTTSLTIWVNLRWFDNHGDGRWNKLFGRLATWQSGAGAVTRLEWHLANDSDNRNL